MLAPALLLFAALTGTPPAAPIKVVTSLTTYGSIAREIVGDRGTVTSIAQGDEDPHFVQPKPSFVALLRDADLFVTTGLDLELWVPDPPRPRQQPQDHGGRSRLRGGVHRHHAARGAHVAQPRRGRHPRRGQPAHSHRPDQRHHHRPEHPDGPRTGGPGQCGLLQGAGDRFREAGARSHHREGPGRRS